jgi:hypothetical protein
VSRIDRDIDDLEIAASIAYDTPHTDQLIVQADARAEERVRKAPARRFDAAGTHPGSLAKFTVLLNAGDGRGKDIAIDEHRISLP